MSPSDAEVALRSLPRRFRAAVAQAAGSDESPDDVARRPGPDGRSAIALLSEVTVALAMFDRALELILISDDPVLHPGVTDRSERQLADSGRSPSSGLDDALVDLGITVGSLADRVASTRAEQWTRAGHIADSATSVTAVDLIRRAVTESVAELKVLARTLRAVRTQRG